MCDLCFVRESIVQPDGVQCAEGWRVQTVPVESYFGPGYVRVRPEEGFFPPRWLRCKNVASISDKVLTHAFLGRSTGRGGEKWCERAYNLLIGGRGVKIRGDSRLLCYADVNLHDGERRLSLQGLNLKHICAAPKRWNTPIFDASEDIVKEFREAPMNRWRCWVCEFEWTWVDLEKVDWRDLLS